MLTVSRHLYSPSNTLPYTPLLLSTHNAGPKSDPCIPLPVVYPIHTQMLSVYVRSLLESKRIVGIPPSKSTLTYLTSKEVTQERSKFVTENDDCCC